MSDRIKIKLGQVVDAEFAAAMDWLCKQSMPAKDAYALNRSVVALSAALTPYTKARDAAIAKHGQPEKAWMDDQIQKMIAGGAPEKGIKELEARRDKVCEVPPQYIVAPGMPGWAAFSKEVDDLLAVDVEIFLDHKIRLSPATVVTARQLGLLEDMVEIGE